MFTPGPGSPERIMAGIKKTHEFSCEMIVQTASLDQGRQGKDKPVAILAWGYGWRNGIFWIFQEKNKLQVALSRSWGDKEPRVFDVAKLPDTIRCSKNSGGSVYRWFGFFHARQGRTDNDYYPSLDLMENQNRGFVDGHVDSRKPNAIDATWSGSDPKCPGSTYEGCQWSGGWYFQ